MNLIFLAKTSRLKFITANDDTEQNILTTCSGWVGCDGGVTDLACRLVVGSG